MGRDILDWGLRHPIVDVVGAVIAFAVVFVVPTFALDPGLRTELYATLATVAALLLTVITFVRSRINNTADAELAKIRDAQSHHFARNWRSCVRWSAFTAVVAILLFFVDPLDSRLATAVAAAFGVQLAAKLGRVVFFYGYADDVEDLSAQRPKVAQYRDGYQPR